LPLFISRRITRNERGAFSSTIHRVAVVSISLSLAALIVAFFVLYGFKDAIRDKVYGLSGHLVVDKYAVSNSFEDTSIQADDSLLQQLLDMDGVSHAQPFVLKAGLLKTEEAVQGIVIKGVTERFDSLRFSEQMVEGRLPEVGGEKYATDVTISRKLANLLRLSVNDEVTLYFVQDPPRYRRIKVTGIYSTGMQEFDEKIIYGDAAMLQRINGWDSLQASGIEVFLNNPSGIDRMEEAIFDELSTDLNVTSAHRLHPHIFEWLKLLNRNVLILLVIIIVVAAMGMISMVLILIMERTKMIGILKALGATNALLRKIFVYQGARLITRGLLIGNTVGLGICFIQDYFKVIPLDVENYYVHFVPITLDWLTLLGLNVMMFVLVGLTLFIPVQVVSGVQPVRAIRFD